MRLAERCSHAGAQDLRTHVVVDHRRHGTAMRPLEADAGRGEPASFRNEPFEFGH